MPAPPGPRGGSKARGRKPTRGGGKHFSQNLGRGEDGSSMWDMREPADKDESGSEEEESGSEESEESGDENVRPQGGASAGAGSNVTLSREERKAQAKARKDAAAKRAAQLAGEGSEEEIELPKAIPVNARANPNKAAPPTEDGRMNRKEREAAEAAAAKERYRKLHEAGKTTEAQADLARLKLIREERELAKQRRLELEEERKKEMEDKLKDRRPDAPKPARKKK